MDRRSLLLGSAAAAMGAPLSHALDSSGFMMLQTDRSAYPLRYPNFPKKLLKKIRATSDLAQSPTGCSTITDTPTGGGVRQSVSTTEAIIQIAFPAATDLTNKILKFWFRATASTATVNRFWVHLFSTGTPPVADPANDYGFKITNPAMTAYQTNGWQLLGQSCADLSTDGTGADMTQITWMSIRVRTSSSTVNLDFSDIFIQDNPRTKAAVIFRADGAMPTSYSWLYNALKTAAPSGGIFGGPMFTGAAAASATGFDGTSRVTTAQANTMIANGAQFGSQGYSTTAPPGGGAAADFNSEYAAMKDWTRRKGKAWMAGYGDGNFGGTIYPSNEVARQAMVKSGIRTIQRTDNGITTTNPPMYWAPTFPFVDELNIPCLNIANPGATGSSINTYVQYEVTRVKAVNGVLILGGLSDTWGDSNVQTAVNNIITDANAGNIEIHTMNTLLDPWLKKYGPAPSRY